MNPTDDDIRSLLEAEAKAPRTEIEAILRGAEHKWFEVSEWSRRLARPLGEEVLRLRAENAKLRALLVDIDAYGVEHGTVCEVTLRRSSCDCGADALQLRINEATT